MNSSVQIPVPRSSTILSTSKGKLLTAKEMPYAPLSTIPPERVGLNGEYDHNGLAKRVMLAFQENMSIADIAELRVMQRGRVVILMGRLPHQHVLTQLTNIALSVDGAGDVETTGIRIG
jgi:hypothetical protein